MVTAYLHYILPIDFAILNLAFYQINLFGMKLQRETLFYKK